MTAQTVTVTEKRVLSSDGIHTLAGKVYLPGGEVKGLLQVVHGMSEHIGRYDEFMRRLAAEGYIVFGHDHLGHGKTANENELGYIAKKDGWLRLAEDVSVFKNGAVNGLSELPDIGSLPYFLMGHSMGSFVVRTASELYLKPDKLIIMGTGGPNPASGAGLALAKIIKLFCGEKHISNLLYFLMFGSYNRKFKENDIVSWLSTDKSERDKNRADKFCTFKFTVSALEDLIKLQSFANRKDWFKNISSDIKILWCRVLSTRLEITQRESTKCITA